MVGPKTTLRDVLSCTNLSQLILTDLYIHIIDRVFFQTVSRLPSGFQKEVVLYFTFGMYLGGSGIDSKYNLSKSTSYKFTAHLRNMKQAGIGERALMNARDDSSVRNFNGKLNNSDSTTKSEMDKEDFFDALKDKVAFYGLHNFFYLPSPDELYCLY